MKQEIGSYKPRRWFYLLNKPGDKLYCGVRRKRIAKAQPKLNQRHLIMLYNFIKRRYIIHLRKDVKKYSPPWTADEVLQDYRFTNIRREHDRETKWLIEHIADNDMLSYKDKLLNIVLFRLFNKSETSELICQPIHFDSRYDPECWRALFEAEDIIDPNRVYFTAAFNTGGLKSTLGRETGEKYIPIRVMKFLKVLNDDNFAWEVSACNNQQEVFDVLTSYKGIGNFLAYQMFVDFTYIDEFPYSENEFTVAGPGCMMGLDYLFEDKDGMTYEECLFWLRDNIDDLFHQIRGDAWNPQQLFWDLPEEDRYMNVMSLENCFCELSKYIRAKEGTGRPRKRYRP